MCALLRKREREGREKRERDSTRDAIRLANKLLPPHRQRQRPNMLTVPSHYGGLHKKINKKKIQTKTDSSPVWAGMETGWAKKNKLKKKLKNVNSKLRLGVEVKMYFKR